MIFSRRSRALVCRQLVELVDDYLAGELDPSRRAAVEEHLAACGNCGGYVDQVRRLLELTEGTPPGPLPEGMLDTLVLRYRERG